MRAQTPAAFTSGTGACFSLLFNFHFIAQVRASGLFIDSYVKVLRAKVRTAFKFIRNDYTHNLRDMDEITCRALLLRLSSVKREVDEVC